MSATRRESYRQARRATTVVGAILFTAAVSGYFMGLQQTNSALKRSQPEPASAREERRVVAPRIEHIPVAVAYSRQNWLKEGPNAHWHNALSNLAPATPVTLETRTITEADREEAVRARARRRAFDGAPPTVPHPIVQDSSTACLACHATGLAVKDRFASRISHHLFANCTQCHVPEGGPGVPVDEPAWTGRFAENTFVGTAGLPRGTRASPEAPPTIPHPTLFRSDCLSCHGPTGLFGLRTPHPERQACTQCHVPSAFLDQHDFLTHRSAPMLDALALSPRTDRLRAP